MRGRGGREDCLAAILLLSSPCTTVLNHLAFNAIKPGPASHSLTHTDTNTHTHTHTRENTVEFNLLSSLLYFNHILHPPTCRDRPQNTPPPVSLSPVLEHCSHAHVRPAVAFVCRASTLAERVHACACMCARWCRCPGVFTGKVACLKNINTAHFVTSPCALSAAGSVVFGVVLSPSSLDFLTPLPRSLPPSLHFISLPVSLPLSL